MPYVWTTDGFPLPVVAGTSHTLTLLHLSGDGNSQDALQLRYLPEPATLARLSIAGLRLAPRARRSACAGV